jgi:hypothetical protein
MAEHEKLVRVLTKTDRWSPQHIYAEELKPLLERKGLLAKSDASERQEDQGATDSQAEGNKGDASRTQARVSEADLLG